jgi:LppP/LprE lipoprotein
VAWIQSRSPGLREEVLAEVLQTDRNSSRRGLAWVGAAAIAAIVVAALLVSRLPLLHPQGTPVGSPAPSPSVSAPPAPSPTAPATPPPTPPASVPPQSQPPPAGPYTTLVAAEAYVRAQPPFARFPAGFVDTNLTWRASGTLQAVRATPAGGASYQGDYFYFFADGRPVGSQRFDRAQSEAVVADDTFAVTYSAYVPGDPHCCPSGGSRTVRFHWDGARLVPLDPLSGATQS